MPGASVLPSIVKANKVKTSKTKELPFWSGRVIWSCPATRPQRAIKMFWLYLWKTVTNLYSLGKEYCGFHKNF